jgi:tripartite-type tricarboxylate transporter receptor subunit TctC
MAPELPTLEDSGLPETDMMAVFGLLAPAGTPKAIVDKLSGALLDGLRTPEVRARINQIGAEPGDWSPEAYSAYLLKQVQRWEKLAAQGKFDTKN